MGCGRPKGLKNQTKSSIHGGDRHSAAFKLSQRMKFFDPQSKRAPNNDPKTDVNDFRACFAEERPTCNKEQQLH